MSKRKTYTRAFKEKAVAMSYERGNAKEVAEELGIKPEVLYNWRKEKKDNPRSSFPGKGKPKLTPEEAEIARLRKELADAREEAEILKKAIGVFSKRNGKSSNS